MQPQIVAEDLQKRYLVRKRGKGLGGLLHRQTHTVEALKGVSFEISAGELVGYIGPNGAGKSTTVKVLSGILVPDGGACRVLGITPWKKRVQHVAHIGVVFGQRTQLWWDLPVGDSFDLLRDIYRVDRTQYARTLSELTERLELKNLLNTPVRQLSLGQRMRCELAGSLIHSPKLLFLDEPTIGLDAVTKLAVRDFVREINRERGVTVILTTHDMDDIEALCSRVLLIGGGRILLDGGLEKLRQGADERILTAELMCEAREAHLAGEGLRLEADRNRLTVHFEPDKVPAARLIAQLNERYGIRDVTIEHQPIERLVARLYEKLGRGEAVE